MNRVKQRGHMAKPSGHISKVREQKLARLLELGQGNERAWNAQELAAVFKHQMAAPISVDLTSLDPTGARQVRILADADSLLLKSFRDLFEHPSPPVELLRLVKEFGKQNLAHPESVLPGEVAAILYYLSIAAALARYGERISHLSDEQLRKGFAWARGLDWVEGPLRDLFELAEKRMSKNTIGKSSQAG